MKFTRKMAGELLCKLYPNHEIYWFILFKQSDKPWRKDKYELESAYNVRSIIIQAALGNDKERFCQSLELRFFNNKCISVLTSFDLGELSSTNRTAVNSYLEVLEARAQLERLDKLNTRLSH
jgi:hypothetical protein